MKTLILAAGQSKRVKPIQDKNFIKFCGITLIEHQIQALKKAGFNELIIVGGAHNLEALKTVAEKHKAQLTEQKDLSGGMAAAILSAEEFVKDEALFIVNSGDTLDDSAYEAIQKAQSSEADAYLMAYQVEEYFPGGYLTLEGDRINGIVEKPGEGNEPSNLVNLVLHLHKHPKKLFEALKAAQSSKDDVYEVALDKLMQELHFEAVPYSGYWQAVKYPWHVLDLMQHFLNAIGQDGDGEQHIHESVQIAKTAVINGPVILEEGVRIFDHATIQGPAYIGKNTIIANNALVRGSMIGDRCVVGYSTEVARSHIGDNSWFHSNYIGDSILGSNVSLGAGAVCANLRLDEKNIGDAKRNKLGAIIGDNVRIGVNTSIMPGVRIGSNSMIGSGLVLAQDIEDGRFVVAKTELIIKENKSTAQTRRPH